MIRSTCTCRVVAPCPRHESPGAPPRAAVPAGNTRIARRPGWRSSFASRTCRSMPTRQRASTSASQAASPVRASSPRAAPIPATSIATGELPCAAWNSSSPTRCAYRSGAFRRVSRMERSCAAAIHASTTRRESARGAGGQATTTEVAVRQRPRAASSTRGGVGLVAARAVRGCHVCVRAATWRPDRTGQVPPWQARHHAMRGRSRRRSAG